MEGTLVDAVIALGAVIRGSTPRAGTKHGNKGWDAALSAIEMVALAPALDDAGL